MGWAGPPSQKHLAPEGAQNMPLEEDTPLGKKLNDRSEFVICPDCGKSYRIFEIPTHVCSEKKKPW